MIFHGLKSPGRVLWFFVLGFVLINLPKFLEYIPLGDESGYHFGLQMTWLGGGPEGFLPMGIGSYFLPLGDWIIGIFHALAGDPGAFVFQICVYGFSLVYVYNIALKMGLSHRDSLLVMLMAGLSEHVWAITFTQFIDLPGALLFLILIWEFLKDSPRTKILGVFFGALFAWKLTHWPMLFFFFLALIWQLRQVWNFKKWIEFLGLAIFVAAMAILPRAYLALRDTGDPLFPFLRLMGVLPGGSELGGVDARFGAKAAGSSIWEWFLNMVPRGESLTELGRYSGRLWIFALGIPFLIWTRRPVFVALVFGFLHWCWQLSYIRYAYVFELLGVLGILLVVQKWNRFVWLRYFVFSLLAVQAIASIDYARQMDFGGRPGLSALWRAFPSKRGAGSGEWTEFQVRMNEGRPHRVLVYLCDSNGSMIARSPKTWEQYYFLNIGDPRLHNEFLKPHWERSHWKAKKMLQYQKENPLWVGQIAGQKNDFCDGKLKELGLQRTTKTLSLPGLPEYVFTRLLQVTKP